MQKRPKNVQKSFDHTKAKCCKSVANSFNIDVEIESLKSCDQVSCGFFTKRDLCKTMHRQTKCCKLTRSKDRQTRPSVTTIVMSGLSVYGAVCCRVAACCSVLQCGAVLCSVLECVSSPCTIFNVCICVCCSVLQCVAVWCSALQCIAVYWSVFPRLAPLST